MDRRIYTSQNSAMTIDYDPEDPLIPIYVDVRDLGGFWLTREEIDAIVKTVYPNDNNGAPALASDISLNESILRLAILHDRSVTFRYAKGSGGTIETRCLEPSEIKEVKGHTIFVGFDPDRDEPRSYRLDRIKGEAKLS